MTFIELLKSLPAIISALLEFKKIWEHYVDESDRKAKMVQLTGAMKNARETNDTTNLEAVLRDIVSK